MCIEAREAEVPHNVNQPNGVHDKAEPEAKPAADSRSPLQEIDVAEMIHNALLVNSRDASSAHTSVRPTAAHSHLDDVANQTNDILQDSALDSSHLAADSDVKPPAESTVYHQTPLKGAGIESQAAKLNGIIASLDPKMDYRETVKAVQEVARMLDQNPLLSAQLEMITVTEKLRGFFVNNDPRTVSTGYDLACYMLANEKAAESFKALHLDYLLMQALTRGDSVTEHNVRIQALRFIRCCLHWHDKTGAEIITVGIIRALVAVAEHPNDKLKYICLETLAEMLIVTPRKAIDGGAFSVLVANLSDGPPEMIVPLTMVINHLFDDLDTREYLQNGNELRKLVAIFTDIQLYGPVSSSPERLHNTASVIKTLLRSWSGIRVFSVLPLVRCMNIPVPSVQTVLLGIFYETLCFDVQNEDAFTNHFTAYLLQKFVDSGLMDQLAILLQNPEADSRVLQASKKLFVHICHLCSAIAPDPLTFKATYLPSHLFANAGLSLPYCMCSTTIPATDLEMFFQKEKKSQNKRGTSPSTESHAHAYMKKNTQIDENSFKQLIAATNVLTTKSFSRWNWDVLLELIQGPLRNSKRLDEAIRTTRFMKRLLSFYRPFKYRFSSVKSSPSTEKYVTVGKELITTFLETPEGIKYLSGNKLLKQIAECLAQVDPTSGITSSEPLFSEHRLRATLSHGYFEMLGVLTRSSTGQRMLSQMRIFNMLYRIGEIDRDDIVRLIVYNMDYTLNGHPRVILSKILLSGSEKVRCFATEHLRTLINADKDTQIWAVNSLVTLLYDASLDVCSAAVRGLQLFCRNEWNLDHFVSMKPSLSHLGSIGAPLNMLFLSRPAGYEYLHKLEYVQHEMDAWVHGSNEEYVLRIEEFLEKENFNLVCGKNLDQVQRTPAPRHFLGELVLTQQGCNLLKEKGYVSVLTQSLLEHSQGIDKLSVLKLKGCMWALGHIASRPLGASFITMDITRLITDIFQNSSICSVQGTAFYAIGLIACSFEGAELLNQCGWVIKYDAFGNPSRFALRLDMQSPTLSPKMIQNPIFDLHDFSLGQPEADSSHIFSFDHDLTVCPKSRSSSSASIHSVRNEPSGLIDFPKRRDTMSQEIYDAVSDLGNHIVAHEASKRLVSYRASQSTLFQSVELFEDIMNLLSSGHYRHLVRRFIFELFDVDIIMDRLSQRRPSGARQLRQGSLARNNVMAA